MEGIRMGDSPSGAIQVQAWPTELPLLILVICASSVIWLALFVSVIGIPYIVILCLFFFITHLIFVTHLRGNAVRLGPNQFPEIYHRIEELAARAGLKYMPEAYILQAGGVLNALATKFLRSKMIVLYSDLLDACGDNHAARDMIIGHELWHLKAGHLRWIWFLVPGMATPFLGSAYSRAREYTCDRYGAALSNDRNGALTGLAILAAGGVKGPLVNMAAMANQRHDLNTGFMTLGKWLASHPPLCDRVTALEPALGAQSSYSSRGALRALGIIAVVLLLPFFISGLAISKFLPQIRSAMKAAETSQRRAASGLEKELTATRSQIEKDLNDLAALVEEIRISSGRLPFDSEHTLSETWKQFRPNLPEPIDPFDKNPYGYYVNGEEFIIWSVGPDGVEGTEDDMFFSSK
jgi:Zn-dependent protease with chaperone function